MEHQHTNAYSANDKIVCKDCVTKDDKEGNECFCDCHSKLKQGCKKCASFHKK